VVLAVMLMAPTRAVRQKCAKCLKFQYVVSGPTELIGSEARPRYQSLRSERPLWGCFALRARDLPRVEPHQFLTLLARRFHMAA
jgi:hypothetical protein